MEQESMGKEITGEFLDNPDGFRAWMAQRRRRREYNTPPHNIPPHVVAQYKRLETSKPKEKPHGADSLPPIDTDAADTAEARIISDLAQIFPGGMHHGSVTQVMVRAFAKEIDRSRCAIVSAQGRKTDEICHRMEQLESCMATALESVSGWIEECTGKIEQMYHGMGEVVEHISRAHQDIKFNQCYEAQFLHNTLDEVCCALQAKVQLLREEQQATYEEAALTRDAIQSLQQTLQSSDHKNLITEEHTDTRESTPSASLDNAMTVEFKLSRSKQLKAKSSGFMCALFATVFLLFLAKTGYAEKILRTLLSFL